MLNKPIRIFFLVVAITVCAAITLILCRTLDERTAEVNAQTEALSRPQVALDARQSALQDELSRANSDAYVMQVAREDYGYLLPGEIRFHVSNIDDLYAVHEVSVEDEP